MQKVINHISFYVDKYPARMSGYMSAIILNVSHLWASFPIGLFIPVAMLLIMMGEGAQRKEDQKTLKALYTENDTQKPDADILLEIVSELHKKGGNHGNK
jgi:hypothetical protein